MVKLRENRRLIIGASGVFCCGMGGYYYTHLEETPITGKSPFLLPSTPNNPGAFISLPSFLLHFRHENNNNVLNR